MTTPTTTSVLRDCDVGTTGITTSSRRNESLPIRVRLPITLGRVRMTTYKVVEHYTLVKGQTKFHQSTLPTSLFSLNLIFTLTIGILSNDISFWL